MMFFIVLIQNLIKQLIVRGRFAKVQGDRKALPLKPPSKAKHLVWCVGSINRLISY